MRWFRLAFVTFTAILFGAGFAAAEPMMAPSESDLAGADYCAVAEYLGHGPAPAVGNVRAMEDLYLEGILSTYKVQSVIKSAQDAKFAGIKAGDTISVRYSFHDYSPCEPEAGWRFSETKMPTQGSRWILFLLKQNGGNRSFSTVRGDYGRWAASEATVMKAKKLVSPASKGAGARVTQ